MLLVGIQPLNKTTTKLPFHCEGSTLAISEFSDFTKRLSLSSRFKIAKLLMCLTWPLPLFINVQNPF